MEIRWGYLLVKVLGILFTLAMYLAVYGYCRAGNWDAATFFLILALFWDHKSGGDE